MKDKYKVLLLRKEGDVLHVVRRRVFRGAPPKTVKFRGQKGTFLVDWERPLYRIGLTRVYTVDVDGNQVRVAGDGYSPMTPEELDVIVGTKLVRELATSVSRDPKEMLMPLILGIVAGFLAAWIIAGIYYQQQINDLMEALRDAAVPSYPWNGSAGVARTLASTLRASRFLPGVVWL